MGWSDGLWQNSVAFTDTAVLLNVLYGMIAAMLPSQSIVAVLHVSVMHVLCSRTPPNASPFSNSNLLASMGSNLNAPRHC